jgi:hypothetical protein
MTCDACVCANRITAVAAAATKILQQKLAAVENELEAATLTASADVAAAVAAAVEREQKTMGDTLQQVQMAHLRRPACIRTLRHTHIASHAHAHCV